MTRLLSVNPTEIVLKNTAGATVFDTNEKQFIVTDFISGSISLGSRSAQNNNFTDISADDATVDHTLSACNAFANTVRGAFFVSTAGQGQLFNLGWFNASGTYLHLYIGGSGFSTPGNVTIKTVVALTFMISGGNVILRERAKVVSNYSTSPSVTTTITVNAITLQYKLFAGTFV